MKGIKGDFKNIMYKQNKFKNPIKHNNNKPNKLETIINPIKKFNIKNIHKYKSLSEKKTTKSEEYKLLSNSIGKDYLNFSQMIIDDKYFGLSNSFSRLELEYKKRINNRYEDCDSSLNSIEIENEIKNKNNEELNKTPSSVCNYYTNSERNSSNKKKDDNSYIRKNLNKIYNQMNVNKDIDDLIKDDKKNGKKNLNNLNHQNKGMSFIKVNRKKLDEKKNKKTIHNSRKNNSRQKESKLKKEEQKNNTNTNFYHGRTLYNNYMNSPLNPNKVKQNNILMTQNEKTKIIKCRTVSLDTLKNNSKNSTLMSTNKSPITINQNNTSNHNLVYKEKSRKKMNLQKPIMLCFDQIKYDSYFLSSLNKTLENRKTPLINKQNNKNCLSNYLNKNSLENASTIKVQTKYHNKSASLYNINKNNANNINEKKIKISYSSNKLINKVKMTNHNPLKISKTLTEKNLINKIEKTPKNSKMNFISTISSIKNNYNSSEKTQKFIPFENNSNLKIYSNFNVLSGTKAKTQSELKKRKYLNFNGSKCNKNYNPYDNTSHYQKNVKQKLIDRMNNTLKNNWNYLYPHQESENKKVLIQDISEIIQTPNKEKYFDNLNSGNKIKKEKYNSDLKENKKRINNF